MEMGICENRKSNSKYKDTETRSSMDSMERHKDLKLVQYYLQW